MKTTNEMCIDFLNNYFNQEDLEINSWTFIQTYKEKKQNYYEFENNWQGKVTVKDTGSGLEFLTYISQGDGVEKDNYGRKIISKSVEKTLSEMEDISIEDLLSLGNKVQLYDDGSEVHISYFEDQESGRSYAFCLFKDGSWSYTSD